MSVGANNTFLKLVMDAQSGDRRARDAIFADCRDYLMFVANRELDERVRAKCAPSDIVQNTLLHASTGLDEFRGESVQALKAWLREILRNELAVASRQYLGTAKRDVRREQSTKTDSQFWRQTTGLPTAC